MNKRCEIRMFSSLKIAVKLAQLEIPTYNPKIKNNMSSSCVKPIFKEQKNPKIMQHSASSKLIPYSNVSFPLKTEKKQITIKTSQLETECRQYEWRQKTELPIVKIINFQVQQSISSETCITVEVEEYPLRLSELKELPLFKILYLLKESIIGFERLVDRVGSFQISPKMIVLSQSHKCKVWINENLVSNSFQKLFISQKSLLHKIFQIFQQKTNKLRSVLAFFSELKKLQTFCSALIFIENYARENKISLSNSCKINDSQRIFQSDSMGVKPFDASMTMSKAPNFIKNNSLKLTLSPKNNKLFDTIRKQCIEQEQQGHQLYRNEKMKVSEHTAADIYCSNSTSLLIKEDEIPENLPLKGPKETQSIMEPKLHSLFSRKYSSEGPSYQINCMTPTIAVAKWEESHHIDSRNNQRAFLGDNSDDQEADPQKIQELFTTNKWNMNVKGLFENDSPMKASFVSGKQTRKTQYEGNRLQLLGSIGKEMTESHISQDFDF